MHALSRWADMIVASGQIATKSASLTVGHFVNDLVVHHLADFFIPLGDGIQLFLVIAISLSDFIHLFHFSLG